MSIGNKIPISIWSNNLSLVDAYLDLETEDITFINNQKKGLYLLIFLDVDQNKEKINNEIYQLIDKAVTNNQKILFAFSLNIISSIDEVSRYIKVIQNLSLHNINQRIVIFKDLYSLSANKEVGFFDNLIKQSLASGFINVSKKGSNLYNPTSITDTIVHIKKLLYSNISQNQIFLVETTQITDLNLAYLLKKNYEEYFKSDFEIESQEKDLLPHNNYIENLTKTLASETADNLENNVKKYLSQKKVDQMLDRGAKNVKSNKLNVFVKKIFSHKKNSEKKLNLKNWAKNVIEDAIVKLVSIVLIAFTVGSLTFVVSSYYTIRSLESVNFYLLKGDLDNASKKLKVSEISTQVASKNYQFISYFLRYLSPQTNEIAFKISNFLNLSTNSFSGILQTYSLIDKVYKSLNTPTNLDYKSAISGIKINLQKEYELLNQLEILLSDPDIPRPVSETIKKNEHYTKIKELKNQVWELTKIIDIIPEILGIEKNSNTFILVQNSHQLKPTGGLIEKIIHVSLEKGKLVFIKSYSPQEIDQLEEIIINTPPLVEKVTGETTWKLRDMNYNPDFPQTAVNIAWYIEKKVKTKPDFIIAVNTDFFTSLLKNKKIQDSLDIKVEEAEYSLLLEKEGSKDLLASLVDHIIQKTLNSGLPLVDLIEEVSKNMNNIIIWSSSPTLQQQLFDHPISGDINSKNCLPAMASSRKCLTETIHLNLSNFSNLSINKYLERKLKLTSTPQVISVDHQLEISTSYLKPVSLVNRNLVEILQLYINKNSKIKSVFINETAIPDTSIQVSEENDLLRHQFIVSTELNKETKITINYTTQLEEKTILPIAYSYNIIPQSGMNFKETIFEVNLPESSRVSAVTSKVETEPNKIFLNMNGKNSFGFNLVAR